MKTNFVIFERTLIYFDIVANIFNELFQSWIIIITYLDDYTIITIKYLEDSKIIII